MRRRRYYGERFALQELDTWHQPDENVTFSEESRCGKLHRIEIKVRHNACVSGTAVSQQPTIQQIPSRTHIRHIHYASLC